MGIHNSASLDRDLAFDMDSLNELLTRGREILTQAVSISERMEASISAIAGIYSGIDDGYKAGALGADIGSLSGRLEKEAYRDTMALMEKLVTKLTEDMPSYDSSLARGMDGIQETLSAVKGRVDELKGLLDSGDAGLPYPEFSGRLKELKAGWDDTTQHLEDTLAEIAGDMLGVTVAAVQYSSDPVNLSTGNFVYDHEDLKIGGEIPLSFHRYYNARARGRGSLGRCFVHNYESRLEEDAEKGKATVSMGDGQKKTFRKEGDGTYRGLHSATETLSAEGDGHVLTDTAGVRTVYDGAGRMTRQENRHGRGTTFTYDDAGRLGKASSDSGTYLAYSYDGEGQLARVTDHTGRSVELSYEKGKLAGVELPGGSTYAYRYGKNGRIVEAVNPRGYVSVRNTYDEKRRVTRQEFPDGGSMEYAYDDSRRQVILTERNGSRITYIHDSRYRNTDILYEDGTREHSGYNGKNRRILHTDRNGNTTRMAYDSRGNLTQVINALGEKTSMTYNADGRLAVLKVNGKEKLRNSYDRDGNLVSSTGADGNGNRITYDRQGRPVSIENAGGGTTDITYDAGGNITDIRDAGGSTTSYRYDSLNRVIRTTDGNGNTTAYEYNEADKVSRVTDALGHTRSYRYNGSGKVTGVTDYDGYAVEAAYNEIGKVSRITDKEGNTTEFSYDRMWNTSRAVQADGGTVEYIYDGNNRLCEERLPDGGTIRYTYDGNGNRTGVTDAGGSHTALVYDALDRVVMTIDAAGAETRYEYDAEGNMACVTDALGNRTSYAYDGMKRCTSKTDALGNTTSYTYDVTGSITAVLYPDGSSEEREYAGGRLTRIKTADGNRMCYTYDGNGNCTCMEDGSGGRLSITYDALNRRQSVTDPDGGTVRYEYDAVGNVTKVTDALGHETRYAYTPNGNLASVTDALGSETRYTHDAMGRLTSAVRTGDTPDKTQTTTYEWNQTGLVTAITDPLGAAETFGYDRNGRLADRHDRDGYHTAYTYDSRGLLAGILYADGTDVSYSYDALRRLKEVRDGSGTTRIRTDALGRTVSVTDPEGKTVGYGWGSMNERLRLTYPDGKEAAYSYNEKGQLAALDTGNGTITYTYDSSGRLAGKAFPDGTTTGYAYTASGRLERIRHAGAGFEEEYSYRYDAAGNKTGARKQRQGADADSGDFGYGYDALNRLTEVSRDGKLLRRYAYDAFGNRTLKEDYSGQAPERTTYRYNASNQLVSLADAEGGQSYAYDRRGNLTAVSRGEELLKAFTFGAANRMDSALEIKEGIEKRAMYHYDAFGNRRGQDMYSRPAGSGIPDTGAEKPQDPEQQVRYTLDITRPYHNLLMSEDSMGQKSQSFYWDGNVAAMEESGRTGYYLQDDLGSPMHLVDADGEIRESYGFDEFGQPLHDGERQLQPFGFTGYQMEAAGGLYFAQARRYDAGAGRFVSEDSVRGSVTAPFTLNRYTYCWGDPVRLVDLDGRDPTGTDINELIDSVKRDFLQDMIRSAEQVYDGLVLKANKACDAALDTIESACDVVAETAEVAFHTIVESARSAYHTAAGAVQDAYHTRVEILKTTASSIKKFAVEFYNEHKKVIDTIVKVLITVEIGAVSVLAALAAATAAPEGLAATAVIALCGTILTAGGVGGLVGGLSNQMTGGSFLNGFCGGFSNACIATAVATMGFPGLGNFLGGFVGNEVTESFNNMDIEDPAAQKSEGKIVGTSLGMGLVQMLTGMGSIGALGNGAGVLKGSVSYYSALFFAQDLSFFVSNISYILINEVVGWFFKLIKGNKAECVE